MTQETLFPSIPDLSNVPTDILLRQLWKDIRGPLATWESTERLNSLITEALHRLEKSCLS